jgi:hypothetical protein
VVDTRPQGSSLNANGEKAPPGSHFEMQRRKGMLISGTVLFGVGYLLSAMYGVLGYTYAIDNSSTSFIARNRATYLVYAVPLAGPALSQLLFASAFGYRNSPDRALEFFFATVVTALQFTGAALAVVGFIPREVLVEDRRASSSSAPPPLRWSIAPMASGSSFGLTLRVDN